MGAADRAWRSRQPWPQPERRPPPRRRRRGDGNSSLGGGGLRPRAPRRAPARRRPFPAFAGGASAVAGAARFLSPMAGGSSAACSVPGSVGRRDVGDRRFGRRSRALHKRHAEPDKPRENDREGQIDEPAAPGLLGVRGEDRPAQGLAGEGVDVTVGFGRLRRGRAQRREMLGLCGDARRLFRLPGGRGEASGLKCDLGARDAPTGSDSRFSSSLNSAKAALSSLSSPC